MISTFIKIFFTAFFINLLYELLHSTLYETCLKAPLKKYIYLILKAAMFDGVLIALIYAGAYVLFPANILPRLIVFSIATLLFAWFWEMHSLKKKKWEYARNMPKILGVGITPLLQLALTGLLSIYIVFRFM